MKKILMILGIIVSTTLFTSCDPYWSHYDWECHWCGAINDWHNDFCWRCGTHI